MLQPPDGKGFHCGDGSFGQTSTQGNTKNHLKGLVMTHDLESGVKRNSASSSMLRVNNDVDNLNAPLLDTG